MAAVLKSQRGTKGEHSPSPVPERAIYGFVLYLLTYVAFGFYLLWAFLPDAWLHEIGITYLPQRLWIFLGPFLLVLGIIIVLLIFSIHNYMNTPDLDSLQNFTDKHQKLIDHCSDESTNDEMIPLADMHISDVNRILYLRKKCI
eukprot:Seg5345.2 transcript_id=Seg5345.2/GoldUCD/mRNA.D3Y31 product="Phosphatidylinositol N-acetylglucosaminyltransferase subunit P" protein_id=Seg5345.2/GoldUCD/D3Y31